MASLGGCQLHDVLWFLVIIFSNLKKKCDKVIFGENIKIQLHCFPINSSCDSHFILEFFK